MELRELYNQIQNPIDNPSVIEKLIKSYAKSNNDSSGFYNNMLMMTEKEYKKGEHFPKDFNTFYSMLFNMWKNNIVSMKEETFIQLYKEGTLNKDFVKLRKYLKEIPDVTTKEEADNILYGIKDNKEINKIIRRYNYDVSTDYWVHIFSRYLKAKTESFPEIKHRLYLNIESVHVYKITKLFIEKCNHYNIPYYFKFDPYAKRDDSLVIYSSTDMIIKYIEVLKEIKREHPEIISKVKEPPILTGVIDGWIGYGSEPENIPGKDKTSFNALRADLIEKVIDKTTKKWIVNHLDKKVNPEGQLLEDYIAIMATKQLFAEFESYYKDQVETEKRKANALGKEIDYISIDIKTGYSFEDLKSSKFRNSIYEKIKAGIPNLVNEVCSGKYQTSDSIDFYLRNGRHVLFTGYDLKNIIRQLAAEISKNDPLYISTIQSEIKKEAYKYGIDGNKICFDMKDFVTKKKDGEESEQDLDVLVIDTDEFNQPEIETSETEESISQKILNNGTIKDVLKNHDLVMKIIAYNDDGSYFKTFIELVNEAIDNKELEEEDLKIFTSGEIANAIVNLDKTALNYAKRSVYPFEIREKLIQLSLIKDNNSYAASFTNPQILKALSGEGNEELTFWSKTDHIPPVGGFAAVITAMLDDGDILEAKTFATHVASNTKKYVQTNDTKQTLLNIKSKLEEFDARIKEPNRTK